MYVLSNSPISTHFGSVDWNIVVDTTDLFDNVDDSVVKYVGIVDSVVEIIAVVDDVDVDANSVVDVVDEVAASKYMSGLTEIKFVEALS